MSDDLGTGAGALGPFGDFVVRMLTTDLLDSPTIEFRFQHPSSPFQLIIDGGELSLQVRHPNGATRKVALATFVRPSRALVLRQFLLDFYNSLSSPPTHLATDRDPEAPPDPRSGQ